MFNWFKQKEVLPLDYPSKEEYFERRNKLENYKQEEHNKDVEFVLLQAREGLKKAMWAGESVVGIVLLGFGILTYV